MKIDLCKLFGVEEGEEFKFSCFNDIFCFKNNELFEVQKINDVDKQYMLSLLPFNTVVDLDIIKLPKKKQFSNDELCVLRNIDKKYKWIARDRSGNICIFEEKPYKKNEDEIWDNNHNDYIEFHCYNHLFNSIKWEDNEPIYIDNYVDRC